MQSLADEGQDPMTEPARFGKYSKKIREMQNTINYLGKFTEGEIGKRDAEISRLRAALQNMIDIYWADGDGQLPEPRCIIEARSALTPADRQTP